MKDNIVLVTIKNRQKKSNGNKIMLLLTLVVIFSLIIYFIFIPLIKKGQDTYQFGLNANSNISPGYMQEGRNLIFAGSIFSVILAILSIYLFITAIKSAIKGPDPRNSLTYRSLSKYGDPEKIITQIDSEIKNNQAINVETLMITPEWLLDSAPQELRIAPFQDIIWIYKIHQSIRYQLALKEDLFKTFIHLKDGSVIIIENLSHSVFSTSQGALNKEADADKILNSIYERLPWIETGYSPELYALRVKNPLAFINKIEERKKNFEFQNSKNPSV